MIVVWSSSWTRFRRLLCRATAATEIASATSVLRALLDPNSRARAASFAGTSSTSSPVVTSCWAMPRPSPVAPSIAHRRSGHYSAQVSSAARVLLSTTSRIGG